jgi:hypothetical protein
MPTWLRNRGNTTPSFERFGGFGLDLARWSPTRMPSPRGTCCEPTRTHGPTKERRRQPSGITNQGCYRPTRDCGPYVALGCQCQRRAKTDSFCRFELVRPWPGGGL